MRRSSYTTDDHIQAHNNEQEAMYVFDGMNTGSPLAICRPLNTMSIDSPILFGLTSYKIYTVVGILLRFWSARA